jgi:nucleotidyltransferase/DNA polymerase involved in DNA repair
MEALSAILHADLDAFYASVEQLLDPSLRGKPIAVGGGVVLAASYEAKAFGIHSGMPGRRARELCPHIKFVGGHFSEYQRLGDAAINVLRDYTPDVERISIDEAFADVGGSLRLFGSPGEIAKPSAPASAPNSASPFQSASPAPSISPRSPRKSPNPTASSSSILGPNSISCTTSPST